MTLSPKNKKPAERCRFSGLETLKVRITSDAPPPSRCARDDGDGDDASELTSQLEA
jgi:hypothetical protein